MGEIGEIVSGSGVNFGWEKMKIQVLGCDVIFLGVEVWLRCPKSLKSLKCEGVEPLLWVYRGVVIWREGCCDHQRTRLRVFDPGGQLLWYLLRCRF